MVGVQVGETALLLGVRGEGPGCQVTRGENSVGW